MSDNILTNYCQNVISSDLVDIFKNNSRVLVAGNSFSGKTRLCIELLKKYINTFQKIIIADSPNSHEFEKDDILNKKIEIYNYIPSISELSMIYTGHVIVVLDDNFTKSLNSQIVMDMFVHGRHKGISTLLVTQNLLPRARFQRDISLNVTHFILLKIRDLSQVQILARQIYGKNESNKVVEIYKFIQKQYKWGHLLIDLSHDTTPDIELRSNITADNINSFELCYKILN